MSPLIRCCSLSERYHWALCSPPSGGGGGGEGLITRAKQDFAGLRFSESRFKNKQADRYSTCVALAFSRDVSMPKKAAVGMGKHGSAPV